MSADSLVKMANDIGRFFASEPKRADAIAGIANHIQRSWEQRMLRKIIAYAREGGAGLDELPREAVLSLMVPDAPGGTASLPGPGAGAGGSAH
ncbi:MAG TPA: formate dehydrogenase subunit delta [Steroidobacteraceae bacterium]|jgi:formate dehydrogenase subunit delta|nr:formate dehydrogenase subunit delta [Steroidobacteraceae bacterium]